MYNKNRRSTKLDRKTERRKRWSRLTTGSPLQKRLLLGIVMAFALMSASTATAQKADPHDVIVATVGNQQVTLAQVENQMKAALKERVVKGVARDVMIAASTRQLVNQLIVVDYLESTRQGLNDDQVTLQIERLTAELAKTEKKLDEFLKERNQTLDSLKQQVRWQFGWAAYLKESLSRENLVKYYDKHKKDFDGTKVQVAHMILGVDPKADDREEKFGQQLKQAAEIRKQVLAGDLTWETAVEKYSTSLTKKDNGGDLGEIERHKPMPEVFAKAAFALAVGEVSEPVRTKYGVHLIKCIKVTEGKRRFEEVRKSVAAEATRFLFNWVLEEHRQNVQVKYTGKAPYFDPDSGKLIRK